MTDTSFAGDGLPLDPWIGRTLADRYRLVATIGQGGMGVVYRAWDLWESGYVVIKMPKRELIGDPKFLQRFEQELAALRFLSHASVVPIVDLGSEEGTPFAVMPYLAGGSLKQRRTLLPDERIAPENPAALWRWLPAIAEALDFVHESGYVHRDVKPDNILFDGLGTPFLGDFGVAKIVLQAEDETAVKGLTGTGMALGTPAYMAPELISGSIPDARIDQYALAVMTYELLAGRKPFDGPTPAAVLLAHATGQAPPLTSLLPAIAGTVSNAVARGMARDPVARFSSCKEFAQSVLSTVPRPAAAGKLQLMCPQCGRLLQVKTDWAGKQGSCPKCKSALTIAGDLRSLWIPSDRTGTVDTQGRVGLEQLFGTPSAPMPVGRSSMAPAGRPSLAAQTEEPESVWAAIKQQLGGSLALQAFAAIVFAFALVLLTVSFLGRDGEPEQAPATQATVATTATVAAPSAGPDAAPSPASNSPQTEIPAAESTETASVSGSATSFALANEQDSNQPSDGNEALRTTAGIAAAPEPAEPPPPEQSTAEASESAAEPTGKVPALKESVAESSAEGPKRAEVPAADAVDEAIAKIREAYESEYTDADEKKRYDFLTDTLEEVLDATDDPVRRFAILVESERLCGRERDLIRGLNFIEQRGLEFAIDPSKTAVDFIKDFSGQRGLADANVYSQAVEAATTAAGKDSFDVALAAAGLASTVAKAIDREERNPKARREGRAATQPKGPSAESKDAAALQAAIRDQMKLHASYQQAVERLKTAPDDEEANGLVGRYLCLAKHEWDQGLPALARGKPGPVRDLAARQLETPSVSDGQEPKQAFEMAGEWWRLADDPPPGLSDADVAAIRKFAATIYAGMIGKIRDPINKALAEKRAGDGPVAEEKPPATLGDLVVAGEKPAGKRKSGRRIRAPIFALVPEPRGLSEEIYPLLPTEAELQTISNHLNEPYDRIRKAHGGFLERLYNGFGPVKWTAVDAGFIIAVNDFINATTGQTVSLYSRGQTVGGGSREYATGRLAATWLLGSDDAQEFVSRARSLPPIIVNTTGQQVSMWEIKEWLLARGGKYPSDKDKATALDSIITAGFPFRGVVEFRQALDGGPLPNAGNEFGPNAR